MIVYTYKCSTRIKSSHSYVTICKQQLWTCQHFSNMESRVNMYDIYLHLKKMKPKSPDVFLTLVLKEFEITNLGRFVMTLFYITCFMWHYPCNSVSILRAFFHVIAFKIRNICNRRKESWTTYSTYAERLRNRIHSNEDQE